MIDFSCLEFIQLIPVTKIDLIDQRTLKISASQLGDVKRVLINGDDSPQFIILSQTDLAADIPSTQLDSPISSISLVGSSNEAASITFTAKSTQQMTDSVYVLQRFMRFLLMDPGSDIFNPSAGVGLQSLMGSQNIQDMEVIITSALRVAEGQVKDTQYPELADSKTLTLVEIQNVSYSINTLTAAASIKLTMADGTTVSPDFSIVGY